MTDRLLELLHQLIRMYETGVCPYNGGEKIQMGCEAPKGLCCSTKTESLLSLLLQDGFWYERVTDERNAKEREGGGNALQELDCKLRKQEGSIKRRIGQLQKSQAAKLEKAGMLLEQIAVQASKLPGVTELLQSWS